MSTEWLAILQACQNEYAGAGLEAVLLEPSEAAPFHSLQIIFEEVGENGVPVRLELAFILPAEQAVSGVQILQAFSNFEAVCSPDGAVLQELHTYLDRLNLNLPVGAFIVLDQSQVVFKANMMIDLAMPQVMAVGLIDRSNGLILHVHQQFIDSIRLVASGQASAADMIRSDALL
ncbi:hypothetical protein [Paenibacillus thalictri]|uniref:YbjN domain-containing protein n=1 Tax=Paenibacillus thalictri TaxID=2527873 RepID=A0A4Q9DUU0_9BACL|nr:hypothetical protein [Paenibacillus thalictri]TBL80784.1 hypothetical protein EYB31_06055 [Paenibacillus thalictri]